MSKLGEVPLVERDTVLVLGPRVDVVHKCSSIERKVDTYKGAKELQIKSRDFRKVELSDSIELDVQGNIWCGLGDYAAYCLARYLMGDSVNEAFNRCILAGCSRGFSRYVEDLSQRIDSLNNDSIEAAIRLAAFDPVLQMQLNLEVTPGLLEIDQIDIFNVQHMAKRILYFHEVVGPCTTVDLDFVGGYTQTLESGCSEFTTKDAIWCMHRNFATDSKLHISRSDKLRVLVHWRMGLHSIHPEYQEIKKLGVYNVRRHLMYVMDVTKLSKEMIDWIDSVVIGYEMPIDSNLGSRGRAVALV